MMIVIKNRFHRQDWITSPRRMSCIAWPLFLVLSLWTHTNAHALTLQEENRYRLLAPTADMFSLQTVGADSLNSGGPLVDRKPSVAKRISVLQVVSGTLGALVGGAVGYELAAHSANDRKVQGDAGYSPAGNVGLVVGSALGSLVSVYAVGGSGEERGSFLATVIGTALPTLIYLPSLDNAYMGYLSLAVMPLQGFLATIAFTITEP